MLFGPELGHLDAHWRPIRSGQAPPDGFHKCLIALEPKLSGFGLEWRLMRNQRQLVLNECAERLGEEIELLPDKLLPLAEAIKPDTKSFIQLIARPALQPIPERVRQDGRL